MRTIGFPISYKENEHRRAIIPKHIRFIKHPQQLYFEKNYGKILGISDTEYKKIGCHIVSREEVLKKNVICDPKIGDAEYLDKLKPGQIIFGWIHATQNKNITDKIIKNYLTGYAWEKMYYEGRHLFWRNNELAGEAAILHAFQCFGRMPYETKVAVIGNGNTARGAIKILNMLGADVMQYNRHTEKLLREEIYKYDVIVNCVLWDITRKDHIIYKKDLRKMKKGAMIIDVSCDRHGGIETSIPSTIKKPTYIVDDIFHYTVDHTPALFYKTFSYDNSKTIYPYIEQLITNKHSDVLESCLIIKDGIIVDNEILKYQNR